MTGLAALTIVTLCYGTVVAISPLLQLRRIRRMGSARDVSLGLAGICWGGTVIWTSYGLAIGNAMIVAVNTLCFLTWTATIGVAIRYRWRARRGAEPAFGPDIAIGSDQPAPLVPAEA